MPAWPRRPWACCRVPTGLVWAFVPAVQNMAFGCLLRVLPLSRAPFTPVREAAGQRELLPAAACCLLWKDTVTGGCSAVPVRPGCQTPPLQNCLKRLQKQHLSPAERCLEYDRTRAAPEPPTLRLCCCGAWPHSVRCCAEGGVRCAVGALTHHCAAPCRHSPGILNLLSVMCLLQGEWLS